MRLYHFINADYAVEAVGLRRLKISRLDKLNDPFEMFAGTQGDPLGRQAVRILREVFAAHFGILCFSRNWRSPMMWGHYASNHKGLCLGFDVNDAITAPVT